MTETKQIIDDKAIKIQQVLGLKLIELGRKASGSLINSLTHTVMQLNDFAYDIDIKANSYWYWVNYGVAGPNIPYTVGKRTGAGNSKYIQGLMNWLRIKGVSSDNKVIKGIAFAIAYKQTSKGGLGKGNPINKGKLGFVQKTKTDRDRYVQEMGTAMQMEVIQMTKGLAGEIQIFI